MVTVLETSGGLDGTDGAVMQSAPLGGTAESVFGADNRVLVSQTTTYPWSAIGKVTVSTNSGTYVATGFMISPYHMLTAGHVVHNTAYGGDGWATGLSVALGSSGTDAFFGEAAMVEMRSLPAWVDDRNFDHDWALVTLDRSIGTHTGWFALAVQDGADFYAGVSVNLAGYPQDRDGGRNLYAAGGTVTTSTAERLFYNGTLDTAGGMSGGPIWTSNNATGERTVVGLHTTGTPDTTATGAANGGTRITADIVSTIDEWMGQDAMLHLPVDRADLQDMDGAFETGLATVSRTTLSAVAPFTVTANLRNGGTAAADAFEATLVISTNTGITEFDLALATVTVGGLAAFEQTAVTWTAQLPFGLAPGTYWLGWRIDTGNTVAEYSETNNTGLLRNSVTVVGTPDIVVETLTPSSTTWRMGDSIAVQWTLLNQGNASAPGTASALYLSTDQTITTTDRLLILDPISSTIAVGQRRTEGQPNSFVYSLGLTPGTYWLGVIADPMSAIGESNEVNNTSAPLAITIANVAPVAVADAVTAPLGEATLLDVLANDTDPEGGTLTLVSVGTPLRGTALIEDGRIRYTPAAGGTDSFQYTVRDPHGGVTTATVAVTITPARLVMEGSPGADLLFGGVGDDTVRGGTGNDTLDGGAGHDSLEGEDGNDILDGGTGNDTLTGGLGIDTIFGRDGDDLIWGDLPAGGGTGDLIFGGTGNDTIDGGAGSDMIYGEGGDDLMTGGEGVDIIFGHDGADTLDGGVEGDILNGGDGNDQILGGDGNDLLIGGAGFDWIEGGLGHDFIDAGEDGDTVYGSDGNDIILGRGGNDLIYGGNDVDVILGGDGADQIFGDAGNDRLYGEGGNDRIVGGAGNDIVFGNEGDDQLVGSDGHDSLVGGTGNDRLEGGPGNDMLSGGDGRDTLFGGDGADLIDGGAHEDQLFGNDGDDILFGRDGNDFMRGDTGNDWLSGGEGNDTLMGEFGFDTMHGGSGADLFVFRAYDSSDRIFEFQFGLDRIQFITGATSFADLTIASDGAGSTVISYGVAGDGITLHGVAPDAVLNDGTFLFG